MAINFLERFRSAWNAFLNRDIKEEFQYSYGNGYFTPQHRPVFTRGNERSIVTSVYTRCAIDISSLRFRHVRIDDNGNYLSTIDSYLNRCLSVESNIDQNHRAFILDVVLSLFDEGTVAIVPVDTNISLLDSNSFDIITMRTGRILEWYPQHVKISLYNDISGKKEEIILPKSKVAIVENPLYSVMNAPNSTLTRLITKLNLLDAIDLQSGSGKLDIIIQLPFLIKTDLRKQQAEARKQEIEKQLTDSKYGIAYIDGSEKITQLNRPAENNLMAQIEYLTRTLYSQLGMTESIFDGTADEATLLNYYNRTIEPVASAITDEMKRKFLTRTGISQGQSIMHFRNPFSSVTAANLADLADKLTRNEILSSNEFRAVIGYVPSKAKGADELRNKNIAQPAEEKSVEEKPVETNKEEVLVEK